MRGHRNKLYAQVSTGLEMVNTQCGFSVRFRPLGCLTKLYQYEKTNVSGQFTYYSTSKSILTSPRV